jgi:hypothetical protein
MAGLCDALRVEVEAIRVRHVAALAVVAEIQARGVEPSIGYPSVAELVKHVARVDTGEVKRWPTWMWWSRR